MELKRRANFLDFEAFDDIALFIVVKVVDLNAAFIACADFASIFFKAFEGDDFVLMNGLGFFTA